MSNLRRAIHGVLAKTSSVVSDVFEQARSLRHEAARSPLDAAYEALLLQALAEMPAREYDLLLDWKRGLTYREIAKQRGMSEEDVVRSLARTYADVRIKTMPGEDPPGKELGEQTAGRKQLEVRSLLLKRDQAA